MAWCWQATSHYLSQCWPRSLSPSGVTRPQGVKATSSCGQWVNPLRVQWNINTSMFLFITDPDNDLSYAGYHTITWTNTVLLSIRTLGTNINQNWVKIHFVSFKKMCSKLCNLWHSNNHPHFNSLALGKCDNEFKCLIFKHLQYFQWILPLGVCCRTVLMMIKHWFREWFDALQQQAITQATVDPGGVSKTLLSS